MHLSIWHAMVAETNSFQLLTQSFSTLGYSKRTVNTSYLDNCTSGNKIPAETRTDVSG